MPIDFVIIWVDGSDPRWRSEKEKYARVFSPERAGAGDDSNADCRYRDSGLLKYWFRGVERFAPWVNKVFFVSYGQVPDWLDVNHPKLVLVDHRDFIPGQYLPTFNAVPIELNIHRIESLSEHFVLFNDDVFLLQPVQPDFFFKEGNPVLPTTLKYPEYLGMNRWSHHAFNDSCVVNAHFDMGESIWDNRKKWFSISALGKRKAFGNFLCYCANKQLPVGIFDHLAFPHLKSTMTDCWTRCHDELDISCSFKFRDSMQVNQWLFAAWNQASGRFYPCKFGTKGHVMLILPDNMGLMATAIKEQWYPQVCLNDSGGNTEPDKCTEVLATAFEDLLPLRSSFELE